jgi:hypothetical protein
MQLVEFANYFRKYMYNHNNKKDLNSSWSTLSKHNRDWILTQMKRASEAILSDYWVFKIPKD